MSNQSEKLDFKTKFAYSLGELSGALPSNILVFFFLFFLTDVAGLNPTLAGMVILMAKIWDALNDPLIGWLSDRTRSPLGRRYPWMLSGAIPLGLSFFLLWIVPSTSNQELLFAYYSIIALIFYAAFTAVLLPHNTLAAELTQGYDERTNLISFRSAFSIGGSIFALVLARVIFAVITGVRQRYLMIGAICGLIAILVVYLSVWGTYRRYQQLQRERLENQRPSSSSLWQQLRIAFTNRPFLCVMGIYLCSWLSVQIIATTLPYFVINCMQLPEYHFTQMAIAVQGTALVMMFGWSFLSRRVGKKAIYCWGIPLTILAEAGLFLLQPGQIKLMYLLGMMAGVGIATAYIVPWSMLPDVVDLDELNTGHRREGIFYGLVVQLQKFGLALALFGVGKFLDWSGYLPAGAGKQPESALWAIRLIIGPIPTVILIMGLVCAYFYPITKQVHQEILLQLYQRNS